MSDFLNFVFSYLWRALASAVLAVVVGAFALRAAVKRHKKKYGDEKPFPWAKAILVLMLLGYLAVVMFVTTGRGGYYTGSGNVHLFRAWREAWNNFSEKNWLNVLLNIGLFVPLGILLPLIWQKFRKWYWMLPAGFFTSLFIEITQYLKGAGLFDVDDLFCNTLGAMIGFWLVMVFVSAFGKRAGKSICHGLMLVLAAASIGGVFAAYELQEYGNLAAAPAFRVDTSGVEWITGCALSDEEQTVSIYNTDPMTKAECEAFGRQFLESLGVEAVDVTIYNEEVYLREYMGNRILEVFYLDGSYDYWDLSGIDGERTIVDESTIRAALTQWGITVPETAAFYVNAEMDHCFAVDRFVNGDTMIDGTLKCSYYEDTGLGGVKNSLTAFTYYGETEIISARAAVEQVKAGWISGGDWFERISPDQVEVLSCELTYQVDTKGFYQPVYEIQLALTGAEDQMIVTIPAIK